MITCLDRKKMADSMARQKLDLTRLDFVFLQRDLKSVVYKIPSATLEEFRNRINIKCRVIPKRTFQNIRSEFENTLNYCIENILSRSFELQELLIVSIIISWLFRFICIVFFHLIVM